MVHPQGHNILPKIRVEIISEDSSVENRCSVGHVLMWSGCELSKPGATWISGVRNPQGVARAYQKAGHANLDPYEDERILVGPHVGDGEIMLVSTLTTQEYWTSAEPRWECGVKRQWPTKPPANGPDEFSPIALERLKIPGVDPWSHYCWLKVNNLLEERGPDATLTTCLVPTEDYPDEGFENWMGAPVEYTAAGSCPAMSFGKHGRPPSRILNFPGDSRATALMQPIPRLEENETRSSKPADTELPIAWT